MIKEQISLAVNILINLVTAILLILLIVETKDPFSATGLLIPIYLFLLIVPIGLSASVISKYKYKLKEYRKKNEALSKQIQDLLQ
jgi:uncharacterized membrane protein YozB (DUF420 family)